MWKYNVFKTGKICRKNVSCVWCFQLPFVLHGSRFHPVVTAGITTAIHMYKKTLIIANIEITNLIFNTFVLYDPPRAINAKHWNLNHNLLNCD